MASKWHDHIKNLPEWKAARLYVLDRDDHTCVLCPATEELQVDHIVPLDVLFADGVTPEAIEAALDVDNLRVLCRPHNASKGARNDGEVRVEWVSPAYPDVLAVLAGRIEPDQGVPVL